MENLTFDLEELYKTVKDRALAEGAVTHEEWSDVIDMTIQDLQEFGEVHDDEEISAIKEKLKTRFDGFRSESQGI